MRDGNFLFKFHSYEKKKFKKKATTFQNIGNDFDLTIARLKS